MIILDTHVLVWMDEGSAKLGKKAITLIDKASKNNTLYVSAISFWEASMLIAKDRLQMQMSVEVWRKSLLEHGLQELPLAGEIAIAAANLPDFHGDPADRFIVASALGSALQICTADKKILSWSKKLRCIDAQK
jgi:PIN domain nuclease of toxin-antitoxin system